MHACIHRGILPTSSSRTCWSRLSHSSTAIQRRSLRVVGGSSYSKTALFNVSQACSIGFMSGEHAGHSTLAMLLSWRNSFTRCARWGRELSSIKTSSSLKFCWYGCTVDQRMSFLYRVAVSAPSMTTSGICRLHIMPPQNIREPSPCCTRWTVCLGRLAWPECLQTCLWRLSGWRHMWHSSVNRTWCQFWQFHSACCWAHLYRAAWFLGVKCEPRPFESKHDVLRLHEKHYSAWWHCF